MVNAPELKQGDFCLLDNMKYRVLYIPNLDMISVPDAEQGIILTAERLPDLVLMDINLPDMDGVEAMNEIRGSSETSQIPVIALTSAAMPDEIERGMKAGFEEYITKPIMVPELLKAIEKYLQ